VTRSDELWHFDARDRYTLNETDNPIITVAPEYQQLVFIGFYPESPNTPLTLTFVPGSTARTPVTSAEMPSGGFRMGPYIFSR